jgi:NitT/TauT family transport system ATP-binding protein
VSIAYAGRLGSSIAVEDATFDVRRSERFAIIGPSGCGKTTLLKAIAGFAPIASGSLLVDGHEVSGPDPDRMVVFQDFDQLFAWRSVRDNVVYALRVARGMDSERAGARADSMLALVDITRAANRHPHELSGGMKQRAAIARALALEPEILLMDEPFGSLDAITRSQLQLELLDICRRTAVTLVLVTHSIQEAILVCERVMVMSAHPGRVREIVTTGEVPDVETPRYAQLNAHLREMLVARRVRATEDSPAP